MPAGENENMNLYVTYTGNSSKTSMRHRLINENEVCSAELGALILEVKAAMAESKFKQLGTVKDIDEAIEYRSQALSLTPDGHVAQPSRFGNLGVALWNRFMRLGELEDLNTAIKYQTQSVTHTPDGHPSKPDALNNLGSFYGTRFNRLGELADLNKAIKYQAKAVLLTADGHPGKPTRLNNLGIGYHSRFTHIGELADLDRAITYQTEAVLLTPDGHPDKPNRFNSLGISHESRFVQLGELADLNKAIDYKSQAVLLTPDGHHDKPSRLSSLGISYESRFGRFGELADLNKAIEHQNQAVLLTPDGHTPKPSSLNNLGVSYVSRFERLGELADLNKAIDHQTQAVLLTPDGHPDKPSWLNNLGISYESRFGRLGDLADLNKAIDQQTQAVLLTPDGHPDRPGRLNNLGYSYWSRFNFHGNPADLNRAIDCKTQAVLLTPDGHPDKPNRINNLGNSYASRFTHMGELAALDKAIDCESQALLLTPDGHPNKPMLYCNLGNSYHYRFTHLGNLSDLELAQSSYQRGAQFTLTHPRTQFLCARGWTKCCLLRGSSPQLAYEGCMELIPYYAWLGTTIDQRYTVLREITDLATEAAAWAISMKAFDLAIEWLEQGRSIVWNQILQLRTPFDDLFLVDPSLAQELRDTASKLEAAGSRQSASLSNNASTHLERDAQQHHHLASNWERLLAQVRAIPGFQRFLLPRKASELVHAATDGPIVVLNAYSTRCDALIIVPGCDEITHLPLSRFSLTKVEGAQMQLRLLVGNRGSRAGGFKRSSSSPNPEETLRSILATLWSDVVQPVLEILACRHDSSINELLHVTWCTTGALSFLPIHAAGRYDGLGPNAFDLVISSYTPTLSALLAPHGPANGQELGVLAIGQEHTQGFCSLPNTVHELAVIKEQAGGTHFQQLDGRSATIDAVLGAMGKHSWVHLACHATQHQLNPARSAFHLHDGALTLETITKCSFKGKGLAFLSACQTATGDEKLADEVVHLAAGMLMAGYPSVIATMWSIQDEDGPQIAKDVYADLLKDEKMDHRQAKRALHKAVAGLREKVGHDAFMQWVPFIHIGV